jgi:glucose-6-phosphate dehydrogenase assembly protein OpcA
MSGTASEVLTRVEEELRALWTGGSGPGEGLKSRACTMNLVVVAATPALAAQYVNVVDEVVTSVPSRAIVVGLDPDADDDLEASVSAVCTTDGGSANATCSERVTLVARGGLCRRLPSCVDALCATDVPMTLVWLARVHADDPTFAPLARNATRIVVDATQTSLATLSHVVRWAGTRPEEDRPGVADLAWTRMAPWQELCARFFDAPRLRGLAERVTRVCLVQESLESGAGSRGAAGAATNETVGPEAALLLGWLATRLGWKAASLAGKLRLIRADGAYVQTQLRARSLQSVRRGSLLGVEIDASEGQVTLRGDITRNDQPDVDAATWRLQVNAGGEVQRLEQHMRLRGNEPGRLLERTLHRKPHDEALAEAVLWADELRGDELVCEAPSAR